MKQTCIKCGNAITKDKDGFYKCAKCGRKIGTLSGTMEEGKIYEFEDKLFSK